MNDKRSQHITFVKNKLKGDTLCRYKRRWGEYIKMDIKEANVD
jgi:hypothetical protein